MRRSIRADLSVAFFLFAGLLALPARSEGVRARLQPGANRKAARDFNLQDMSGASASLAEYRGKIVLLNFWATWCGGCQKELPWFAEFHSKYHVKGLAVLGVSVDDDGWDVVKPFVAQKNLPYRILLGNKDTKTDYAIGEMPVTHLIDREGRIAASYVGMVNKHDLDSKIAAMLARP
jgi:peroxiredoxin